MESRATKIAQKRDGAACVLHQKAMQDRKWKAAQLKSRRSAMAYAIRIAGKAGGFLMAQSIIKRCRTRNGKPRN